MHNVEKIYLTKAVFFIYKSRVLSIYLWSRGIFLVALLSLVGVLTWFSVVSEHSFWLIGFYIILTYLVLQRHPLFSAFRSIQVHRHKWKINSRIRSPLDKEKISLLFPTVGGSWEFPNEEQEKGSAYMAQEYPLAVYKTGEDSFTDSPATSNHSHQHPPTAETTHNHTPLLLSPCQGKIIKAEKRQRPLRPVSDTHTPRLRAVLRYMRWSVLPHRYLLGNHYIIHNFTSNYYVVIAHIHAGSLIKEKGDYVDAGEIIGEVAHDGLTNIPFMYMYCMNRKNVYTSCGLPFTLYHQ